MKLTLKGISERKSQLKKEFDAIKNKKQQAQNVIKNLDVELHRLQGKYELLDDLEKEVKKIIK